MITDDGIPRDELKFVPLPLATGQLWRDPATDELLDIESIKCQIELVGGRVVEIKLDYLRSGCWNMPDLVWAS